MSCENYFIFLFINRFEIKSGKSTYPEFAISTNKKRGRIKFKDLIRKLSGF
jgi:hypothetical protein